MFTNSIVEITDATFHGGLLVEIRLHTFTYISQ